jgi:hypothetical protein
MLKEKEKKCHFQQTGGIQEAQPTHNCVKMRKGQLISFVGISGQCHLFC